MSADELELLRSEFATLEKELRRVVRTNRLLHYRVRDLTRSRDTWEARARQCGWSQFTSPKLEATT